MDSPVIVIVDIETRPHEVYAWSMWNQNHTPSQLIRPGGVMMFAAKTYGEDDIESHCEWDNYDSMIRRAHEIYSRADYVVTYNGRSFDNKHLQAAWALAGLPPPSPWRDVDLLKTVRKFNLPFRKLGYVAEALGLMEAKSDSGGMDTWREIIRPSSVEAEAEARQRMVDYCRQDVAVTENLFTALLPWIDGLNIPLHMGDEESDALCTRCGSPSVQRRGWAYTTTFRYRRYQCTACRGWMRDKRSEPTLNAELRNL